MSRLRKGKGEQIAKIIKFCPRTPMGIYWFRWTTILWVYRGDKAYFIHAWRLLKLITPIKALFSAFTNC